MVELTLYTPEMTWEVLSFFPGNAEVKILRAQPEAGARTLLVRLAPGGKISPHSHLGAVLHYVPDGEYETDGEMSGVGTYRLLPNYANVETSMLENKEDESQFRSIRSERILERSSATCFGWPTCFRPVNKRSADPQSVQVTPPTGRTNRALRYTRGRPSRTPVEKLIGLNLR